MLAPDSLAAPSLLPPGARAERLAAEAELQAPAAAPVHEVDAPETAAEEPRFLSRAALGGLDLAQTTPPMADLPFATGPFGGGLPAAPAAPWGSDDTEGIPTGLPDLYRALVESGDAPPLDDPVPVAPVAPSVAPEVAIADPAPTALDEEAWGEAPPSDVFEMPSIDDRTADVADPATSEVPQPPPAPPPDPELARLRAEVGQWRARAIGLAVGAAAVGAALGWAIARA